MLTPLILPSGTEIGKLILNALIEVSVKPKAGSIVYCNILPGYANHTGVYVGNEKIIHLSNSGLIEEVSSEKFMAGFKVAPCIWVTCQGEVSVGSELVMNRAKDKLYSRREYNLISDNCYQFCAGCLSGNFENSSNLFSFLESDCEKYLGFDNWHVWLWRDLDRIAQKIDRGLDKFSQEIGSSAGDIGESFEDLGEDIKDKIISMMGEFEGYEKDRIAKEIEIGLGIICQGIGDGSGSLRRGFGDLGEDIKDKIISMMGEFEGFGKELEDVANSLKESADKFGQNIKSFFD